MNLNKFFTPAEILNLNKLSTLANTPLSLKGMWVD